MAFNLKFIFCLLCFIITTETTLFAQSDPIIRAGAAYPAFFKGSLFNQGERESTSSTHGIQLFLAGPDILKNRKSRFSTIPGMYFLSFSEKYESPQSALGGHAIGEFKHKAFGIYSQFLYDIVILPNQKNMLYTGITAGVHLFSKTRGKESGYLLSEPIQYWNKKTDENGKHFFGSYMAGVLLGIKPASDSELFLMPALELTFYPNYARVLDYYTPREELKKRNSMISLSLIFGLGKKKAVR